ncbi:Methylenetetrahydrofolate dehydrogenase [NAD(+)] [Choanephora cucurbitarum]|uniref:Methylenetetrahydrofolate dehydrogenase [NAD(+)] n=1 Tax=Choanephora cucurbitarum TaxID=101091 RepID=A0A1C7N7P6_9FUNG|nr:Methylenetetrahydrofolate dehydrogenase [NAD(+)] [Choanephora cucurbitarum]
MSTTTSCKTVLASKVSASFRNQIKADIKERNIHPKLVGFLANEDPAAMKYADWTAKTCAETGVDFELRKVSKMDLEEAITEANQDKAVNGIMIYYPVFGGKQDAYLQSCVSKFKDVEGLCHEFVHNVYHNIRFMDEEETMKCIIPCTPLAIVKILEYIGVYNPVIPYGNRLYGRTIAVVNRSEIVGRPLAAMLSNDGAKVYSIDVNGIQLFTRGTGLSLKSHKVEETEATVEQVVPQCDVVITGVPSANYKMPTHLLKEGVVAINFSSLANFQEDIKQKASIFVPSVGKVTVAMLERNLLRLHDYQSK